MCRRCKKQVQHENAPPYEFWSLEDSTKPRTQHPRRRVSRGRCLSTFVTRQEQLAPMQSSGKKRTRSVLFLLHQHKLRTTAANGKKSQNIAATVRKHHEWLLKLGVSAFNGQSTERSKAILTKCAPVECRKKYPPHGLSRANTAPHHAAAFWEKHGWISKLGVSIPRAKQ